MGGAVGHKRYADGGRESVAGGGSGSGSGHVQVCPYSESLLSELDPLELLLPDSEELLLLSLEGPPEGAGPDLSEGGRQGG